MRTLVEAAIALLIVWLFLNYKKTGSVLPTMIPAPAAQPFSENPGAPGSPYESGGGFIPSAGAKPGCGCGGGSASGAARTLALNAPSVATGPGGTNPMLALGGGTTVFWNPTPTPNAPAPAPVHLIAWGA